MGHDSLGVYTGLPVIEGICNLLFFFDVIISEMNVNQILQLTNVAKLLWHGLVQQGIDYGLLVEQIAQFASADL